MTTTSASPQRVHDAAAEPAHRAVSPIGVHAPTRAMILVVGRDKLFADAIGAVLEQRGTYEIVSAYPGQDPVQRAVELRPAIALISLERADIAAAGGVPLIARMRTEAPGTLVLGMVHAHDPAIAARATELGLQGLVYADDSVARFIRRIDEALRRGSTDIRPTKEWRSVRSPGGDGTVVGALTTREFEVLELLVQSLSGREIAERLGISRNTVRSHMQSIFHKLHVHSRLEAAAFAMRHDMFEPPRSAPMFAGIGSTRPMASM
jgi:DNA-binding NarL/FixJ family response regulator